MFKPDFSYNKKINQEDTTNASSKITLHICLYHVLKINFGKLRLYTQKTQ